MATYGDIRTKFIARMNRRDMSTTLADGFLQDAITRIQRKLRVPAMEKSIAVTVDDDYAANGGIFIPADYLMLRRIMYNDTYALQKEDESRVVPLSAASGSPEVFCRRGGLWVLGPTPQESTDVANPNVVRVDYYSEFPDMSAVDDETTISDIASDLILYGALSYACDHFNDKRGVNFEGRYTQIITDIQEMADTDETSGGARVQPAYILNDGLEDCG